MKKISVFGIMLLILTTGAFSQETFRHRWDLGEKMIVGISTPMLPLLGAEVDFSHRVSDTRWRWGVAPGILVSGAEYDELDEAEYEEEFVKSFGHIYVKGYADYAFSVIPDKLTSVVAFYLHGGIAPSWLGESMNTHENKGLSAMGELGVGMDGGFVRLEIDAGFDKRGLMGVYGSLGFYFGRK
ncbi:MAG: hypothetical protein IJ634_01165 [Bacteroidales bacterium]|nr:hypothetical protein [Bacteroidales bacterium]